MKRHDPPVYFRPDLFPVGDHLDELMYEWTQTPLKTALEEYLIDHDPDLQDKGDQVIRDLLAGKDVRKQLDNKRMGRRGHPTTRTIALAVEHARLVKNGIKKATATKLIVGKLKELKLGVDDEALSKEIQRAIREFPSLSSEVEKYELKLKL